MNDIYVKSDSGEYELQSVDLVEFFKANSDDEGNVTIDHILHSDCELKADKDGRYKWVLSDFSLDSDKERIDPKGWELKTFKDNPIVLWSHDIWIPAIGKAENLRKTDEGLIGYVSFDESGLDPLADRVKAKVDQGIITKGSVGFKTIKIQINDDDKDPCILVHLKQELREFSICNIPANANASVQRMDAEERRNITINVPQGGIITEEQLRNMHIPNDTDEVIIPLANLGAMKIDSVDEEETFAEFAKRKIKNESPTIWDELFGGDTARPAEAQDQGLKYLFSEDDETMTIGEILGKE